MGYRYLDRLVNENNLGRLMELADLAAGAGSSANNAFELQKHLQRSKPMQLCEKRLASDPASSALIAARHITPPYAVEALRAMPRGRLGHTFATVLGAINYDLDFYPKPDFYNYLASDADYISYRIFATHDLHHILTGFSLDTFGELGVLSVSVAQASIPSFAFLDLFALMLTWFHTDAPISEASDPLMQARNVVQVYRTISQGLEMGLEAKPLFLVLWEERMEQDLDDLRHELGIEPVRDGLWSWYSNPTIAAALAV